MRPRLLPAGVVVLSVAGVLGCGGGTKSSPTSPSSPKASSFVVSGTVHDKGSGGPIAGAKIDVVSGASQGASATADASGSYRLEVKAGSETLRATMANYVTDTRSLDVSADTQVNFSLDVTAPGNPPATFSVTSVSVGLVGSSYSVARTDQPITFSWGAVSGATSYVLEIGTATGGKDVLTVDVPAASYNWSRQDNGHYFARVRGKNSVGTGPASADINLYTVVLKDCIEALFLGSGPLGDGRNAPNMSGWREGTTMTVTLSSALDGGQQSAASNMINGVTTATGGGIRATSRTVGDAAPVAGTNEITVAIKVPPSPPCAAGAAGCTAYAWAVPYQAGVFGSANVYIGATTGGPVTHELGHALYGFADIKTGTGLFYASIMGYYNNEGQGLSELDRAAVQRVYSAGLRAGALRSEFVAAGLINP